MSIDFQIAQACSHLIVEEVVNLSADRQTMFLRGPIASNQSVRIAANGVYIPPGGYYSSATVVSGVGPFEILNCEGSHGDGNELLTITTRNGQVTITLPLGARVQLRDVKSAVQLQSGGLVNCVEVNGAIKFTEVNSIGTSSYIHLSGKGVSSLGFSQQRVSGRMVYPGWVLLSRPNQTPTLTSSGATQTNTARYPYFRKPLKGSPVLKVTYVTVGAQCPRCQGTLIENDYQFTSLGSLVTISNEDLLYQACMKAILTQKGSNPYHPTYGTTILKQIGRKITSYAANVVKEDIARSLGSVQGMQIRQAQYQNVGMRERLYKVSTVAVSPSPTDPTLLFCEVVVQNMSNRPISLSIAFSVPGAVALAGSNGMSLGTEAVGL